MSTDPNVVEFMTLYEEADTQTHSEIRDRPPQRQVLVTKSCDETELCKHLGQQRIGKNDDQPQLAT